MQLHSCELDPCNLRQMGVEGRKIKGVLPCSNSDLEPSVRTNLQLLRYRFVAADLGFRWSPAFFVQLYAHGLETGSLSTNVWVANRCNKPMHDVLLVRHNLCTYLKPLDIPCPEDETVGFESVGGNNN